MNKKAKIHEIPEFARSELKSVLIKSLTKIKDSVNSLSVHQNKSLIEYILTVNLETKTDIVIGAIEKNSYSSKRKLRVLQASVAGVLFPEMVFASNGFEQLCESCVGPLIACGIIVYAFILSVINSCAQYRAGKLLNAYFMKLMSIYLGRCV